MRKVQLVMIGAGLLVAAAGLVACGEGNGESAASGTAVRTIEVAMLDELRFEPSSAEVGVGETVRFALTNEGETVHDFSLGDSMDDMGDMGMGATGSSGDASDTAAVVGPGEVGELTFTFDEAGEVEFGCHQSGHLETGMVFTAHVS